MNNMDRVRHGMKRFFEFSGRQLYLFAGLLLAADIFASMPCLCREGVILSEFRFALLLVLTARFWYLAAKKRATRRDLLIYEGIFIAFFVFGEFLH